MVVSLSTVYPHDRSAAGEVCLTVPPSILREYLTAYQPGISTEYVSLLHLHKVENPMINLVLSVFAIEMLTQRK